MPYGPRGMPVMYPAMPLPPGAVPGPNQVTNENLDVIFYPLIIRAADPWMHFDLDWRYVGSRAVRIAPTPLPGWRS